MSLVLHLANFLVVCKVCFTDTGTLTLPNTLLSLLHPHESLSAFQISHCNLTFWKITFLFFVHTGCCKSKHFAPGKIIQCLAKVFLPIKPFPVLS